MRIVIQRVKEASVFIDAIVYSKIKRGILAFVAFGKDDDVKDASYLIRKMMELRIFPDDNGVMNCSIKDLSGELMIVSQFTLYGDCKKGRRPSYSDALSVDKARGLYDDFIKQAKTYNIPVKTGQFQAKMDIHIVNWGPITLLLDSKKVF